MVGVDSCGAGASTVEAEPLSPEPPQAARRSAHSARQAIGRRMEKSVPVKRGLPAADAWRMQEPASIINEYAVDPFLAKVALERLRARARDAFTGSAAAAGAAVPLLALGQMPVAVASFAGAIAGGVVCAYARA